MKDQFLAFVQKQALYVVSFLCILAGFFFPILDNFSTHTTSPDDASLIMWLIHQSANFWTGQGSLYNWPFFHPFHLTATYSDMFLSLGLLLVPVREVVSNPVAQHNLFLIGGTLGNGFTMYLLSKKLWKKTDISWMTAIFFAFSYLLLQFQGHLHTYLLAGIPLGLWCLIKYVEHKKWWSAVGVGICFLAQALNAPMTGYFFLTIIGIYILAEQKVVWLLRDYLFMTVALLSIAICIWFYLPYVITATDMQAVRTIRDTAHFSFSVERWLWPDVIGSLLIIGTLLYWRSTQTTSVAISLKTITLIAVVGGIFMLGPVVKVAGETLRVFNLPVPLPYAIAYYLVPGLQAFRAVGRWSTVLHFGLTLGLGYALARTRLSRTVQYQLVGFWLIAMFLLSAQYFYLFRIPTQIPPIYEVVKAQPQQVLAEFPMTQWDMTPFDGLEHQRLLSQLHHDKTLYNGVSGFSPFVREQEIHQHWRHFPDQESLVILKAHGVDLVIIHFAEFLEMTETGFRYIDTPSPSLESLHHQIDQSELELITCLDNDCLYRLKPSATSSPEPPVLSNN